MSNATNTSEHNDTNHSYPPAPSLVDLDEISASASNNATVTTTHMDEKHDTDNDNTTNQSASSDIISNVSNTEGEQSGVSIDDNNLASTALPPHQNGNYSDKEDEHMTFTKDDSNVDAQPTNSVLETSDDGSSHFDKMDGDDDGEIEPDASLNDTDANNTAPSPPALDDSTTSNIGKETLGQDPIDISKEPESDRGDFDFNDSENNNGFDEFGQSGGDNDDFGFDKNNSESDDDFNDFGQANGEDDDDFGDFDDFEQTGDLEADGNDDDFGDFGDLPEPDLTKDTVSPKDIPLNIDISTPKDPTLADQYVRFKCYKQIKRVYHHLSKAHYPNYGHPSANRRIHW
ncbi:hypothetical protein BCR42DRAFT_42324 [Absidia repens]|uniref:Uncharacterized protein n=1 Tax=Absidia repens TaxID=90262 RepID=A0A1X2IG17_9FUNG|nr:hypothetical protein BCR42DRAFT_42324 [Absidia repens]